MTNFSWSLCEMPKEKYPAAVFLRWKFSTLLSANAAALCCICIILLHLDKNRCRTETSASAFPTTHSSSTRNALRLSKILSEECRKRRCILKTHCCPCSGLLCRLHYFCCTQPNLFPLLWWLNCFALKVGDPLGCLSLVIAYYYSRSNSFTAAEFWKPFKNECCRNKVVNRNEKAWDWDPQQQKSFVFQRSCFYSCLPLTISERKYSVPTGNALQL